MRSWLAVLLAAGLSACVPYPGGPPPEGRRSTLIEGVFPGLDPGAARLESLHFLVHAYGQDLARAASQKAEESYERVMIDTNLFSFRPRGLYEVVIYSGPEEYGRKTGQPSWSGGVSVGNAIYTYAGPGLERTIAHEMTHLVFFEYMGKAVLEHRWVNEGLAVYEEGKAAGGPGLFAPLRERLKLQPLSMDQMIRLVPATEREYAVSLWYAQSESLVRHMIERGGRLGFSEFLARLRDGRPIDEALAAGFPSVFRSLPDLERSWQAALR